MEKEGFVEWESLTHGKGGLRISVE